MAAANVPLTFNSYFLCILAAAPACFASFLGFQCKYARHIINELDVDNFYCKYTTIGRDVLDGKYECVINETRFYLKGNSYVYKMTTHVHPLPGTEFNEEGPKMGQEKMKKMFKFVEKYLIANPSAYP
ncbi:hypothetical protein Ancab_019637 [Ancistrocladus abbreviatus]